MMTIDLKPYLAQRSRSCVYAVYTIPVARPAPQERKPGILAWNSWSPPSQGPGCYGSWAPSSASSEYITARPPSISARCRPMS